MSGWERCAKARFSRMMGIPKGAGCRKLFLFISSRASAVNETCFYLASRRVGIIGTVAIESMQIFRAFLLRKRESRPKPLLSAVLRGRRGCPFAGGVRLRQKVWADLWLDGGYTSVRVGAGNGRMPIGGMEVRRTVFQGGAAKGEAVPPHGRQAFKGDLYLIIEGTVPNRLPGTR